MKRTGVFIPIEIWNLGELHPNERVLLAEVASFEEKGKQCFASNEHFANMLQVSIDTARGYISKLVNAGFLVRDGDRYNRRLRRITQTSAQIHADERVNSRRRARKSTQTSAQISPHTITDTKTITKTNTKRDKTPKVVLPFQSDNFSAAWKEWIEYKKAAHRFTYKTPKSEQRALITLADAYKEEQDAIERIHQGITNGWKGLVFDSPKNRRTHAPRARNIETSENIAKLRELAENGRIDLDNRRMF
jgi:DNA-binding MarR family transcriptional regulator